MHLFAMRWPRTREILAASLVLTIILVWASRYFVNPDGISYLDLSDNYEPGHWETIANAHWSPAYPLLLATLIPKTLRWTPWEPIVVHIINGWLFLLALACFEVFLAELGASNRNSRPALNLHTAGGRFTAHMIFLWCALVLITIRVVTPDMLLAALGFAAAAFVVRIQDRRAAPMTFVLLGVMLGLAALTKSFMMSVSLVLMLSLLVVDRRVVYSIAVFAIVISPQLVTLSTKSGSLTFGDTAKVAYLVKVNDISKFEGTSEISRAPLAVTFPTDNPNETYPLWDDPARWLSGTPLTFDYSKQMGAFIRNLRTDAGIGLKIVIPLILVIVCRNWGIPIRHRLLAAISLAVLAAYSLLHSEARLIGFWIALGSISLLAGTSLDQRFEKIGRAAVYMISIICLISVVTYVIDQSFSSRADRGLGARDIQRDVAESLDRMGIVRGSKVGLVGDESDIYWARLARVQIVAQIPLSDAPAYWSLSEGARDDVNRWIGMTDASALVASWTSPAAPLDGWTAVQGTTRYSIFPLKKQK